MTHQDAGHYAAKHPDGQIDATIAASIRESATDSRISCSAAHAIAAKHACSPRKVGVNIDLLEMRINACQLGLFGHGARNGKAVKRSSNVDPELGQAIRDAVADGRLACEAAWAIAKRFGLPRIDVANACETLQIKIGACQLGAF